MTTLSEFLLARIAEDEAVALGASTLAQWDEASRDWLRVPGEPAVWVAGDGYASGAVERTNGAPRDVGIVVYDEGSPNEQEIAHIARHDPAHVLARCEADRRIVELHELKVASFQAYGGDEGVTFVEPDSFEDITTRRWMCSTCSNIGDDGPCATLRLLALPYADHPDYREEWKP